MIRCPTCAAWITTLDVECPTCHAAEFPDHSSHQPDAPLRPSNSDDEPESLQAIARFRHAAEAGFFLDELTRRLDITAEVVPKEQLDSLHASWSTDFVLMVPRTSALVAAQCLQELVEQTAEESQGIETRHPSSPQRLALLKSGTGWVPLALTFAAGAVSCWGFERFDRPPRAAVQPAEGAGNSRILEKMSSASDPWTQAVQGTKVSRRVSFDRQTHTTLWEEDRDGDGQYEIRTSMNAPD